MKAAVIEDDPEIREIVSVAFETTWPGSQVVTAPNGTEGLALVKSSSPDIVILDVALPEGDSYGFDVCKELRAFSDVPVIMVTARNREVDVVKGLEMGAADYLTKPIDAEQLVAAFDPVEERAAAPRNFIVPSLARVEWEHIQRVLTACGGNVSEAARALHMHRRSLQRKLLKYPVNR